MKKKATKRAAKASSRQSTLNFPTSTEPDSVAESASAVTSTKSAAKKRSKRTADFADDADKTNASVHDSSVTPSSAPTERNMKAQGKKRSAAALGQHPSTTESPEGATHSDPLPQGWQWSTIEELCDVVRGGSPRPAGDPRYFGGDIPWITVGPITADNTPYLHAVPQTITALGKERSRFVEPGTLLLTNSGATLGVPKITLIGGCINDGVAALLNVPESLKLYLLYFLQTQTTRLRTVNQGAAQPNLNTSIIKSISVPVAPPAEQHRIVAEIEKQFTRLDAGVAALKRVQANLKRYRAAVLKAACEGKLVPTEAELARAEGRTYETGEQLLQRILTQRRQEWQGSAHYKDPSVADTTNLPTLPHGWTWATPDQLAAPDIGAICAGPFGTIFKAHDFRAEGIPIIFLRHVAPGRYLTRKPGFMDVAKWKELFQPYSVFGGELLVTKLGEPPGVCAIFPEGIGPAMVTPDVIKMTPNTNAAFPKFLMHYFNSQTARDFATGVAFGTTRLRLTLPIFREMPVPLPPHSEQTRIVDEVERRLSVVEELESVVSANLHRATRLRQSILQTAFSGNI